MQNQDSFKFTSLIIKFVAIAIAFLVVFISKYMFVFFLASMFPTIIAMFFDKAETKCVSATVCTFNLIGVIPYIIQIVKSNAINVTAKYIVSDIFTWGNIYCCAFIGQLIIWILPSIFVKAYIARSRIMISLMESKRDKICVEWGIDNKGPKKNELSINN